MKKIAVIDTSIAIAIVSRGLSHGLPWRKDFTPMGRSYPQQIHKFKLDKQ